MAALLKTCATEWQPITRLIGLTNLPHGALREYLDRLLSAKLIEVEVAGRRRTIHTTIKGVVALNGYRNAVALLNGQPARWPNAIGSDEIGIAA